MKDSVQARVNEATLAWDNDTSATNGSYFKYVTDWVNQMFDELIKQGEITAGQCWATRGHNTEEDITKGNVCFDFEWSPT